MRSRWIKFLGLLIIATITEPAMAEENVVTDALRSEIVALVDAEAAAWNKGSAAEFAERALPDISFTNIFGMFSVGKAPFVAQHERIFTSIYKGSKNRLLVEHIAPIKPDVVIVDLLTVVTGIQPPPGVLLIQGGLHSRLQQVLVRQADGWWIASFHNVAVNPAYPPKP